MVLKTRDRPRRAEKGVRATRGKYLARTKNSATSLGNLGSSVGFAGVGKVEVAYRAPRRLTSSALASFSSTGSEMASARGATAADLRLLTRSRLSLPPTNSLAPSLAAGAFAATRPARFPHRVDAPAAVIAPESATVDDAMVHYTCVTPEGAREEMEAPRSRKLVTTAYPRDFRHRQPVLLIRERGFIYNTQFLQRANSLYFFPEGDDAKERRFHLHSIKRGDRTHASDPMEPLNAMSAADAADAFVKCCGSPEFGRRMAAARPFASFDDVLATSRKVWYDCPAAEWELAFKAHPRIGDVSALKEKFASTANWCEGEQSAAQASMDDATINELAEWNKKYEEKFGRVFLICASGKPADVILAALKERYPNEQDVELRNAADEQQKTTEIRLEKLRADLTAKL